MCNVFFKYSIVDKMVCGALCESVVSVHGMWYYVHLNVMSHLSPRHCGINLKWTCIIVTPNHLDS